MVLLPDGTMEPNIPPPDEPEEEVNEDDSTDDEYDTINFSLGRNLGGTVGEYHYGRLGRYRVVPPILDDDHCHTLLHYWTHTDQEYTISNGTWAELLLRS